MTIPAENKQAMTFMTMTSTISNNSGSVSPSVWLDEMGSSHAENQLFFVTSYR
jgi:hypothetical protein